jgi:drug/metabolite transporter superfamily protein YnfA
VEISSMTIPTILVIVALILALVDEFQANGRSLVGWAVVLVCVALLWGQLT